MGPFVSEARGPKRFIAVVLMLTRPHASVQHANVATPSVVNKSPLPLPTLALVAPLVRYRGPSPFSQGSFRSGPLSLVGSAQLSSCKRQSDNNAAGSSLASSIAYKAHIKRERLVLTSNSPQSCIKICCTPTLALSLPSQLSHRSSHHSPWTCKATRLLST
jgi:hypothetical protein